MYIVKISIKYVQFSVMTTMIGPPIIYESKRRTLYTFIKQRMGIVEMIVLRMIRGVIRENKLKNDYIRCSITINTI